MRPIHRVFVTGGTGFVGRSVVAALRAAGYVVRCLVRRGSERELRGLEAIERVEGDVRSPASLTDAVAGCDAVVHLVGIIREYPRREVTFERVHVDGTANVLKAATDAGVRRYVHMSALGARPGARSRYHRTKWAAEEMVRGSGLPWTIFRPSIIYGRGDGFISLLARMVDRLPVVPVIGPGTQRSQPVRVQQVAAGFAGCLGRAETAKQTYEVGGPDAVTLVELLDLIGHGMGRTVVRKFHVPVMLVRPVALVLEGVPSFPLTRDQLTMLEEDNTCDCTPFFTTFGLEPVPLRAGIEAMLR